MAETSVAVQPAATSTQPAQPLQLKLFAVNDGVNAGGVVYVQAMCPVDDQGRAVDLLSEETGRRIVELLTKLVRIMSTSDFSDQLPPDGSFQ